MFLHRKSSFLKKFTYEKASILDKFITNQQKTVKFNRKSAKKNRFSNDEINIKIITNLAKAERPILKK
jgi:hypothetical protein